MNGLQLDKDELFNMRIAFACVYAASTIIGSKVKGEAVDPKEVSANAFRFGDFMLNMLTAETKERNE